MVKYKAGDLPVRLRRAWEMKQRGLTAREVAKKCGVLTTTVYYYWMQARKLLRCGPTEAAIRNRRIAERWEAIGRAGRCECGLCLPCSDHGPTRDELAVSRPGAE